MSLTGGWLFPYPIDFPRVFILRRSFRNIFGILTTLQAKQGIRGIEVSSKERIIHPCKIGNFSYYDSERLCDVLLLLHGSNAFAARHLLG